MARGSTPHCLMPVKHHQRGAKAPQPKRPSDSQRPFAQAGMSMTSQRVPRPERRCSTCARLADENDRRGVRAREARTMTLVPPTTKDTENATTAWQVRGAFGPFVNHGGLLWLVAVEQIAGVVFVFRSGEPAPRVGREALLSQPGPRREVDPPAQAERLAFRTEEVFTPLK